MITAVGHLINIVLSLYSCKETKSIVGVSIKSFELYVVVFGLQLLITNDYVTLFIRSLCVISILYLINLVHNQEPYKSAFLANESHNDYFPHWKYILLPSMILAIFTNLVEENLLLSQEESSDGRRIKETLSVFCQYLEASALVPQIALLYRFEEIENFKWYNIASLSLQNLLYVYCVSSMSGHSNSIVDGEERFKVEDHDQERRNYEGWFPVAVELLAGLIQISVCVTFIYLFFRVKFYDGGGLQKLR